MSERMKIEWKVIELRIRVKAGEHNVLADALAGEVINECLNTHGCEAAKCLSVKVAGKSVNIVAERRKKLGLR